MENFYLILVVVLFALAISDLIVGVSNDAVNFLNSAIGSKAAPKWVIFLMASLGVLIGATFSSGMMEVARKGIFHPDMFYFSEIMLIFLAVMITDVILLDMFNTFGMPTSTTVSIVFELLGAAVAVAAVKIKSAGGSVIMELAQYINSEKALAIITGILVSVFVAFTVGAIVQYITRLVFSFRYRSTMQYAGGIFGGLAITAITYFMLIKGLHGSSFASLQVGNGTLEDLFANHTLEILLISFLFWGILLQVLRVVFKIKILKIIVLAGTFALAMAFAGNDLVNFIGVPLAGFNSFKAWVASGGVAPETFSMEMLSGKVGTPTYMLLIAGLVMISTLILSKKARSVVATTVDLSRQSEGETERFNSSLVARVLVRSSTRLGKNLSKTVPKGFSHAVKSRFEPFSYYKEGDPDAPAFDKVRAAVNLVVASILIAIGTSLKLPLSTTYVTFMVAMGTSLSDRAWDRETAVYRISGVFSVIGGWFLTAIIAFSVSAVIALIISLSGTFMIFVFIAIAIFMVIRTQILFKKRANRNAADEEDIADVDAIEQIIEKSSKKVEKAILASNKVLTLGIESFLEEDRVGLKKTREVCDSFSKKAKRNKEKLCSSITNITSDVPETSHFYVQMIEHQREMAHAIHYMLEPMIKHVENNHKPFIKEQVESLTNVSNSIDAYFNYILNVVKDEKFDELDNIARERDNIMGMMRKEEKAQIRRIKNKQVNTRNSQLFFKIMTEIEKLLLHTVNLVKTQRDFINYTRQTK